MLKKIIFLMLSLCLLVFLPACNRTQYIDSNTDQYNQSNKDIQITNAKTEEIKDNTLEIPLGNEASVIKEDETIRISDIVIGDVTDKSPNNIEISIAEGDVSYMTSNETETNETNETSETNVDSFVEFEIIGGDYTILERCKIEFSENDTVFDLLKKVTKDNSIQMEFTGSNKNVYIRGIDNLYEFDFGPQSGWLFYVNGDYINSSCGAQLVSQGDVISWMYEK